MILIDCAHDDNLTSELLSYLIAHKHTVKLNDNGILAMSPDKNIQHTLESFLKETKKQDYTILESDTDVFVISKPMSIDQMGFVTCEFCNKAFSDDEKLEAHKVIHGQGMPPVN